MYSPNTIKAAATAVEAQFPLKLKEYTIAEVDYWLDRINSAVDLKEQDKVVQKRPLDEEERSFIANELMLSKISFPYYAERYVYVRRDKGGDVRFRFWESQDLMLNAIGKLEDANLPIFLINLKARQIGACLKPDTRVLTADLRWVTLDEIVIGTEIVATDEYPKKLGQGQHRKLRRAVVEDKQDVYKDAFEIEFTDGKSITATAEHRFLYRTSRSKTIDWREVRHMKVGGKIRTITDTWKTPTYEDGWFGGIIDGEGSLRKKERAAGKGTVCKTAGWATIKSIKTIGVMRMVDLQTSTKTFIAEGLVSHNSTLSEAILTHKVLTTPSITSLLAADEAKQSEFLFNMMERVFNHLPFWMRPHRQYHVKGAHMFFDRMDSNVLVDAGNKRDGNVGQGKALHCGHLSELATWQNPEMVSEDLIPAILSAASPHSFWIFESTAKGKMSHWRDWWIAAKRGRFHGFVPVFIAWWVIKEKYQADPPEGWSPSERVQRLGRTLNLTKGITLTRKQMYWWDRTYESYKEEGRLNAFYAEYASDDEEAFQLTGKSVFPIETIQDLRRKAMERPMACYEFQERGL